MTYFRYIAVLALVFCLACFFLPFIKTEASSEIKPPQYLIEDRLQGNKVLDVSNKPAVFWSPNCKYCHKVLEQQNSNIQYCAVWVKDNEDMEKALQLAEKYKINSLYTNEIENIELDGLPAIMFIENDELQISYGQKSVLKVLQEKR